MKSASFKHIQKIASAVLFGNQYLLKRNLIKCRFFFSLRCENFLSQNDEPCEGSKQKIVNSLCYQKGVEMFFNNSKKPDIYFINFFSDSKGNLKSLKYQLFSFPAHSFKNPSKIHSMTTMNSKRWGKNLIKKLKRRSFNMS